MRAAPLFLSLAALLSLALPLTAQEQAPAATEDRVVATFKGGQVTVGELRSLLANMPEPARLQYQGPEGRKALLEDAIRFELLAAEAKRRGYDQDERVLDQLRRAATTQLIKERIDDKITPESVAAEAVAAYYKAHEAEFNVPERRRASRILLKTADEAKALLDELKKKDLRAFRDAAQHKSLDEVTKLSGGDLGYFDKFGNNEQDKAGPAEALAKAAFALKTSGELAPAPIKTEQGYSLLMLTGKKPAQLQTLAQAEGLIRGRLVLKERQAQLDALIARLKKEQKPEVHAELISLVKFDTNTPAVPKKPELPEGFPEVNADKPAEK